MKRYRVETTLKAETDIVDSFIWGSETWGVEEAIGWANELRTRILKNLSNFPFKYPVAPERDGSGREYRQMIVGRYRVIFHIEKSVVRVVHVIGSFVDETQEEIEDTRE
ncbi:MAG: type II toxin-antitoxin system RelE/ParE family toxin [Pyrinomonadaceae bacterium]|nr:type II toxin-antitoxin system RelE/ParE family toxin [Pyrinomonadaceae bacterium]